MRLVELPVRSSIFVGLTSTMLKLWLFISKFHKFIRRSSADMNVSPSLLINKQWSNISIQCHKRHHRYSIWNLQDERPKTLLNALCLLWKIKLTKIRQVTMGAMALPL